MRIFSEAEAGAERNPDGSAGVAVPGALAAIAFASAKGGVGKSALAVNLAAALALDGRKVGILDADLNSPNMLAMLGLKAPRRVFAGEAIEPIAGPLGLRVVSSGLLTGGEPPPASFLADEPELAPASRNGHGVAELDYGASLRRLLNQANFGALDILLIDLAPGLERLYQMARMTALAGVVIVTQPSEFSVMAANRAIEIAIRCKTPVLGVIENMIGFSCGGCHTVRPLMPQGDMAAVARAAGVATLARLPFDARLAECCDRGVIFIREYADTPLAKSFHELARTVAAIIPARASAAAAAGESGDSR